MNLTVRDEHCSSFKGLPPSDPLRLKAVSVCVMAHRLALSDCAVLGQGASA